MEKNLNNYLKDDNSEMKLENQLSAEDLNFFKKTGSNNIQEYIQNTFVKDFTNKYSEVLKDYLKKNLLQFGHSFNSDEEFLKFTAERIQRIQFEGTNDYEYYLDFKSNCEPGILIGITNEDFVFSYGEDKVTATIGTEFKPV